MESGERLGRYEIKSKIGSGGMGEVYLAVDTQLDRRVALKVLLPEFCSDPERTERFRHEAKAASALNHPGIITIYEVGIENEHLFIATELVEGRTLREIMLDGKLLPLEAISIVEQTAEALAVAHQSHIIHRDVKPDNIMVRQDGLVKILDFGLAKPVSEKQAGNEDETMRLIRTQPGIVMGSVRYMSPEQARGKETDARTDVWSLGVVLYELLCGENPFDGETVSDSLAAIIHVEPPLPENFPEDLRRVLRKALRKKAEDRYQSIRDFALDLREIRAAADPASADVFLASGPITRQTDKTQAHPTVTTAEDAVTSEISAGHSSGMIAAPGRNRVRWLPVTVLLSAVVLAFLGLYNLPGFWGKSGIGFRNLQVSRLTDTGNAIFAEISADGKFVAYVIRQDGRQSIVVRQIAAGSAVTIVPPSSFTFLQPAFSADGNFVYYVAVDGAVGTLYKIPTLGGESEKLVVDIDSKPTISSDGKRIAFVRHDPNGGGDSVMILENGTATPFVHSKEIGCDQIVGVDFAPDGDKILVGLVSAKGEINRRLQLATVDATTKAIENVDGDGWIGVQNFEWIRDGSGIVLVGKANAGDSSQVWQVDYPGGARRQITTDTTDYASVSISGDGSVLVSTRIDVISSLWSRSAAGEMRQIIGESRNLLGNFGLAQLADGRLIFGKASGRDVNLYVIEESGGGEKQLTTGGINHSPAISPDGRFVYFSSNRGGAFSIWRVKSDGTEPMQITNAQESNDGSPVVTKDGASLIFVRTSSDGGNARLMKVSAEGGEAARLFPNLERPMTQPIISNDGKFLAYQTFDFDSTNPILRNSARIVRLSPDGIVGEETSIDVPVQAVVRFSADDRWLSYLSRSGIDNIRDISLADRREKPLTDFTSGNITNFLWSRDARKLFIVRAVFSSDLVLIRDGEKV